MHTTATAVDVPRDVRKAINGVLRDRLGDVLINVEFQKIEVDDSGFTVVIELRLKKDPAPHGGESTVSLFGLTSKVRNAMGSFGREVFPVLRPVAYHS